MYKDSYEADDARWKEIQMMAWEREIMEETAWNYAYRAERRIRAGKKMARIMQRCHPLNLIGRRKARACGRRLLAEAGRLLDSTREIDRQRELLMQNILKEARK